MRRNGTATRSPSNDVSMVIEPGEFFCLLGPVRLRQDDDPQPDRRVHPADARASCCIEGRTVNDLPPHKRNVNTVFQNYALFPHMTVAQNVAFGLRMEKLSGGARSPGGPASTSSWSA